MKKLGSFTLKIFAPLPLCAFALIFFVVSNAQTLAPNAPGKDAQWATAGKQGVGTSASLESKVWFTLAQGVMTEVYYPDVTVANVHLLQFVVVNPKTKKVETEQDDAIHQVKVLRPDSLTFQQINTAKSGEWTIKKTYATHPNGNSVWINVQFETKSKDLQLYFFYDPSLKNSGLHDSATTRRFKQTLDSVKTKQFNSESLKSPPLKKPEKYIPEKDGKNVTAIFTTTDLDVTSLLYFDVDVRESTSGFFGTSDGLAQLLEKGVLTELYDFANNENVVQMGHIVNPKQFTVTLAFGKDIEDAWEQVIKPIKEELSFESVLAEYEKGWSDYIKTIRKVEPKYQAQFNMAAMQLKAHEDKTVRGANIASLTIPWGGDKNANENTVGGYHLIWSRDLYQVATAFMALGDTAAAIRALNFLFKVQQKSDGSFPQNSFLDGKPFWGSLQLDEVAFPLILAYQLQQFDKATYENHVKKAADFLVKTGPKTPQERWEEKSGYSPSTIAAEIAGLVCAAHIAKLNGDEVSATIYLATADDWARKVEMWTATTNGKYGDGNYYIRLTENGKPDSKEPTVLNNNGGTFIENEIVDAGFLELVRLGIKSPDDPLIVKSLKVIDEQIKIDTPNGEGFYRYNHDGYGEMDDGRRWNWDGKYTGKGRLWALLSGERGQYELALYGSIMGNWRNLVKEGKFPKIPESTLRQIYELRGSSGNRLETMRLFANDGLMIPEQIWDRKETPKADRQFVPELKFGENTGSATPLAWSMAQFIRLAVNLQAGKNLDTPDIVYNRYVKNGIPAQASNFGGTDQEFVLPVKAGEKFSFPRQAVKGAKVAASFQGVTKLVPVNEKGEFLLEITAPETEEIGIVAVEMPDSSTAFERVKVRSANKTEPQKFSAETIEKIKSAKQSPLIENGKVILFYRGAAKNVMVAGDMTSWNPGRLFMQKIAENLFAVQIDLARAARAEYKFIVDGKWIADELNPNKLDNGVGDENSVLTMPEYKPTLYGVVSSTPRFYEPLEIQSKVWNETRKIQVYAPFSRQPLPVLYFQDGNEYINRTNAIEIQKNLVEAKKIKPFIMVFIDYKDRMKEYWASDDYAKFVATEVVPAIDAKYNTIKSRDGRAILGASLGGITSVWVGLKYPEIFSRIGGQSASFWVDNERVVKELSKLDASRTKFKFYFDDGTLEGAEDTRRVNILLRGKGFPVTYIEGETGHNWTSWRDRLADAFVGLMN